MTPEEAIEICRNIMPQRGTPVFEALDLAIKALEQQPKDCVSRKDVLAMKRVFIDEDGVMAYAVPTGNILRLQSVTPTRLTGRWERRFVDYKKCSICGEIVKYYHDFKYCPYCGARMTESEE